MKKILLILITLFALSIGSVQSQEIEKSTALYIRGGYSWFTGVVGGELQMGNVGIGGGWMPTKTPLTGQKENAYGICVTYYTGNYNEDSFYLSGGYIINGYRYENSYGTYNTDNMIGLMGGYKIATDIIDLKGGVGYGFYSDGGTFTAEITLGINILGF